MADQIVITEKSSQAKDVRAAVGSRFGEILPAEGHLLDLLEPEDVVPAWKRWSPILLRPEGFGVSKPWMPPLRRPVARFEDAARHEKWRAAATQGVCPQRHRVMGQDHQGHQDVLGQAVATLCHGGRLLASHWLEAVSLHQQHVTCASLPGTESGYRTHH
jgi:DNA topoisomerase-3